jgi:hypothetical protein
LLSYTRAEGGALFLRLRWIVLVAFVGFSVPKAQASDCPLRFPLASLLEKLDEAQAAFARFDAETFTTAMESSSLLLPCLKDPVSTDLAARVHRAEGIRLYAAGNKEAALSSLRAAKAIEPNYAFPKGLFPEGYALLSEYEGLDIQALPANKTPLPKVGVFHFDGLATRSRPSDRPTFFQHIATEGDTLQTVYLRQNMPLPDYAINPKLRNTLLAITASLAVAAGGVYGYGWKSRSDFFRGDLSRPELAALQARTNVAFALAGGLATMTAGGVVGVILVGER